MKNRSTFHTLAVLTVVLTFRMPFTTLAQQKSVQPEISESAAEILKIRVAEQDASNDINRFAWFGAGLSIAYIGAGLGFAGCLIDDSAGSDGTEGLFVGATAGVLLPIISIFASPVHVPARRLTGKSPEYVEIYADAYQKKMRLLKTGWAVAGAATGCGAPIIGCLLIRRLYPPQDGHP